MAKLQLVLVDDWELRGDGSGDMRAIQFATLRRLLEIYQRNGFRATINAEVMQQLYHRELGANYPELARLADEWEELIKESHRNGHDVQLHIHPQWIGADYENGRWRLSSDWSILNQAPETVDRLIAQGKQYLESLLRSVDPAYSCVSYRAGAWCIAPSDFMLSILARHGITFDISIVNGLLYRDRVVDLDYRNCEEGFLPYYPDMRDARKLAHEATPIVCVPTFSFAPRRWQVGRSYLSKAWQRAFRLWRKQESMEVRRGTQDERGSSPGNYDVWGTSRKERLEARVRGLLKPGLRVADLSTMDFSMMRSMLASIRRQAAGVRWPAVPVVLENHTKDISDFRPFEAFARHLRAQKDVEVITLADVHHNLKSGLYTPVRAGARA